MPPSAPNVPTPSVPARFGQIERREWWLWSLAVLVTLSLTLGIASFLFAIVHPGSGDVFYVFNLQQAARGLVGAVLLFDIYILYQQLQLQRMRRRLLEGEELFRLVSENAADMIALVDVKGNRLYNSPAYQKVLGYSPEELETSSPFEQIHPDDRYRVLEAAESARRTGVSRTLEYRIRHKDGSWRVLESSSSAVVNQAGEAEKLVIVNRDITARKHAEDKLAHRTFHDGLTDLPNRILFLERVQRAFSHARRHPEYKFAVLLIDIDDFKKFNDSFGPAAGDKMIVEIGSRLVTALRHYDAVSRLALLSHGDETLARLGGDEFAVLLDDIKDASDAIRAATRLQEVLAAPFVCDGQELFSSASLGIALSTTPREHAEELLRDADIAMHRAKSLGKARFEIFDSEMHTRAVNRLRVERELRGALARGELRVYYQPIVRLEDRQITGFETLVRWQHPELGLVLPGDFIDVAEETGLLVAINRRLLQESCHQTRLWQGRYTPDPPLILTANVTSKELAQPDMVSEIRRVLQQTGMKPGQVQLEIRETVAMADAEQASGVFSRLKQLGVGLSIDDFGTGYSSLSRLQALPIDTLKIDRSFISGIHHDADKREIVRVIVMLGQQLGMKVVAEGTETTEQVDYVRALGCDFAQGYFFSRPVAAEAFEELLAKQSRVGQLS